METSSDSPRLRAEAPRLAVLCLLYLLIALPAGWKARHMPSADGLAYIQVARHYGAGQLSLAVNGYWSPLFSWLLIVPLALGADPLTAAHLLSSASGVLWVVAGWLLGRRLELDGPWRVAALGTIGLVAVVGSGGRFLTPDVLATGLALLYLFAVSDDRLLDWPRAAAASGLLGGACYLAKGFLGPFFLAHFTTMVLLRCWAAGCRDRWRQAAAQWLRGVGCFALLAGPWILAISLHHGRLTISNAGPANHALVGPEDRPRWHPWIKGLWQPEAGRLTVWEDPSDIEYPTWSPLASRAYFMHQLGVVRLNLREIPLAVAEHDPLRLRWLALLGLLVLAWRARAERQRLAGELCWLAAIAIHVGGYLPVQSWEGRYHYQLAVLLTLLLFRVGAAVWRRWPLLLALFIATAAPLLWELAIHAVREVPPGVEFRRVAERMARVGCRGPLAASDFRYGMYVAHHQGLVALGQPKATTLEGLERELRGAGVRTFVVWGEYPLAGPLAGAPWAERVLRLPRDSEPGLRWETTIYRIRER